MSVVTMVMTVAPNGSLRNIWKLDGDGVCDIFHGEFHKDIETGQTNFKAKFSFKTLSERAQEQR